MDTSRYSKIPAKNYKRLPDNPSIEHLKNQAKDLLAAYKEGEAKASKRVRRFIEEAQIARGVRLKDAQEVVAREYTVGAYKIDSWDTLTAYVAAMKNLTQETLKSWLEAAVSHDWRKRGIALRVLQTRSSQNDFTSVYLEGLEHPDARVRNLCLGELDHSDIPVDEKFMTALRKRATEDPNPNVRRSAIHTMFCQRCKSAPPAIDLEFLARVSLHDENTKTRRVAEYGLGQNPDRAGAVEAVRRLHASASEPQIKARAELLIGELMKERNPRFRP